MDINRKEWKDRFKGKVAIVTGGSSGIGRAITEELCKEGASVAFTGISEIGANTQKELKDRGFDVLFLQGDMIDETFCRRIVDQTLEKWGKVNYLVNNAFSFIAKGIDAATEDWHRSYFVGPVGYARMAQNVIEPMKKEGGGAIVNISSISGHAKLIKQRNWMAAVARNGNRCGGNSICCGG
jgi:NAD(P)-dependent dehydrogenase (short-subunit alcohol dehydrogenase family)